MNKKTRPIYDHFLLSHLLSHALNRQNNLRFSVSHSVTSNTQHDNSIVFFSPSSLPFNYPDQKNYHKWNLLKKLHRILFLFNLWPPPSSKLIMSPFWAIGFTVPWPISFNSSQRSETGPTVKWKHKLWVISTRIQEYTCTVFTNSWMH